MNDTYDAGYLPDDADCDQDSIRVELAYSHDFYTAIIEGQEERIAELEKVELETVAKARKMFVVNARKFGYFDSVGHTIQELQSWEKALKAGK